MIDSDGHKRWADLIDSDEEAKQVAKGGKSCLKNVKMMKHDENLGLGRGKKKKSPSSNLI